MSTTASERFKVTEKCENQTYRIALTHSSPSISLSVRLPVCGNSN